MSATASPDTLRVIVFEGVQNLALYAAQAQGCFAAHGLDVQLSFTPNSWTLRDGLQQGSYDIAHTAVDNAIAMVELAGADVAVVMGGDNGFNGVYVQPDIADIAALRGRTVLVDAPNTAFALVLYRILSQHGMERSRNDYVVKSVGATPLRLAALLEPSPPDQPKYAGAILNLPYRIQAERAGLRCLGEAVDLVGPYLSTAGFVMRPWAAAHADVLQRYIRAYVEGLRWALDPAHRGAAIDLLAERLKLPRDIAEACYAIAADPLNGLARDAAIDLAGLANVLNIRAVVEGAWEGKPPSTDRYVDARYWTQALQ